jgi:hypothetical protein
MLTVLNKGTGCGIFGCHQTEVESSTIAHLIISVIKAAGEQNVHTRLDFKVLLTNTKLGQCSDSSGTYNGVFQNNAVINVSDVLSGVRSLGALNTKQMQDTNRQLSEFAVLDEFAKMSES